MQQLLRERIAAMNTQLHMLKQVRKYSCCSAVFPSSPFKYNRERETDRQRDRETDRERERHREEET